MRYRVVVESDLEAAPEVRSYHRWWLAAYVVAWLYAWRHSTGVASIQEAADLPSARLLPTTLKT